MSDQAPGAQPDTTPADGGQGDGPGGAASEPGASGGSPFAAVLDAVPHGRDAVEAALKKAEGPVTQRFQEHAQFRDTWQPWAEAFGDQTPELGDVQQALSFAQLLENPMAASELIADPDAFGEWWEQVGQQLGYLDGSGQPDPAKADEGNGQGELLEQVRSMLDEALSPFKERFDGMDQQERDRVANETVTGQLDEISTKYGLDKLEPEAREKARNAILKLAHGYAQAGHTDAIQRGFQDYQEIVSGTERALVEDRDGQPAPAVPGNGQPNTGPEKVGSFKEAKRIAEERLTAAAST